MNPLTLVKRIQNINSKEASLGISEEASWHAVYKESAYVYVGGIPFDLTEGDLLAVFAQYGEIVDVNLVRDKGTGKSKGFAFVAYEDQRSTVLAVDNLNGAQILGRTIRVDHVSNYKKKEEEDEELAQQKREERGVCRAFQRGECTRGDGCKFSHNEQRAANTGWGAEDHRKSRRTDDKFEVSHGSNYKKKEEDDDEELAQQKREERGVCRAFQRGECTRGNGCRFSHNEQRAATTGWGAEDHRKSRRTDDKCDGLARIEKNPGQMGRAPESSGRDRFRSADKVVKESRVDVNERETERHRAHTESYSRDKDDRGVEKRLERRQGRELDHKDIRDKQEFEERSRRHESDSDPRENAHRREERGSRKHESESYHREDQENRRKAKRTVHERGSSSPRHRGPDEDRSQRSHR